MKPKFRFFLTLKAQADLERLSPELAVRVRKKLRYFFSSPTPMIFAKPLTNLPPATHRFRIGNLRVTFFRQENTFYIMRIGFRRDIYQRH